MQTFKNRKPSENKNKKEKTQFKWSHENTYYRTVVFTQIHHNYKGVSKIIVCFPHWIT